MKCIIYKATNKTTNKSYIGFTSNSLSRRISEHKSASKNSNYLFHKAINKYGIDDFEWNILYQSNNKSHTLTIMESHFIEKYDTYKNGYNMTLGGEAGMMDRKHDKKTKKKMKENHADFSGENHPFFGKKHTEQSKEKMRIARLNNPNKVELARKAGKISAEKNKNNEKYKEKLSNAVKLIWEKRRAGLLPWPKKKGNI